MIRPLVRWCRVVFPPWWAILTGALPYLILEPPYAWVRWGLKMPDMAQRLLEIRNVCVGVACGVYAFYRVLAFHPLFHQAYGKWLAQTPWRVGKPLPLGPIRWTPQDAVLLGIALAALRCVDWVPVAIACAVLSVHLLLLALSFSLTGLRWHCYGLLALLGLAVRVVPWSPWASLAVVVLAHLPAYRTLDRSLARFPWQLPAWWIALNASSTAARKTGAPAFGQSAAGWPFDQLSPRRPQVQISLREGTAIALLAGWFLHAAAANITDRPPDFDTAALLISACVLGAMVCVLGRILIYALTCWPPISLWGRIRTGRWIIPGYDRVFVAPLLSVLPAAVLLPLIPVLGLPWLLAGPACLAVTVWITLNVGPSLTEWKLTGKHRIGFLPNRPMTRV